MSVFIHPRLRRISRLELGGKALIMEEGDRKKRTFRKFSYRGIDLDNLVGLFAHLVQLLLSLICTSISVRCLFMFPLPYRAMVIAFRTQLHSMGSIGLCRGSSAVSAFVVYRFDYIGLFTL